MPPMKPPFFAGSLSIALARSLARSPTRCVTRLIQMCNTPQSYVHIIPTSVICSLAIILQHTATHCNTLQHTPTHHTGVTYSLSCLFPNAMCVRVCARTYECVCVCA